MGKLENQDLVIADLHNPFADLELLELFLSYISSDTIKKSLRRIFLNGDITDFPSISKFSADPARYDDLQYEFTCLHEILYKIRKYAKSAEIHYICGNHEERLIKYLNTSARPLRQLTCLEFENLAGLHKQNIKYHDHYYFAFKDLIITHGTKLGLNPASLEARERGISGISGHVHFFSDYQKNFWDRSCRWLSIGHMADINKLDKLYSKKFSYKWNQGFATIRYNKHKYSIIPINCDNSGFYCPISDKFYQK